MLTVQPSLDAGQLQIKDLKLSMRAGKGRHYKVTDIHGRHFVETGLAAGFSREQVARIFQEIDESGEKAFAKAFAEMPKEFPAALFDSVKRGFDQWVARLVTKEL